MNSPAALHCSFLLTLVASSLGGPLSVEVVKNHVKLLAQTTVIRIQKLNDEFQISPKMVIRGLELIPDVPLDKPVWGLASILENLNTFQEILVNLQMEGTSQIAADMTSLQGIIQHLSEAYHCAQHKAADKTHLVAFLKNSQAFQMTIANVALTRLQRFLSKLVNNLDQLKMC